MLSARPSPFRAVDSRTAGWALALSALALTLNAIPLFGRPGFESALALAVAVSLAGADLGSRAPSLQVGGRRALAALAPAIVIACIGGLIVKTCDWGLSLRFYPLLPGVSALVAVAWGRAARLVLRGAGRALLASLALGLASVGHTLWHLYAEPPVFAYDPVFGMWPGALYDEALGIPAPLAPARMLHLLSALAAVAVARLLAAPVRRRAEASLLAPPILLLLACALLHHAGPAKGFRHDRETIAAALGRTEAALGTTLHVDARMDEAVVATLLDDIAWARTQVAAALGVSPEEWGPLEVFAYKSFRQRRRLMGADRTTVAKPWRGQVNLAKPKPGDPLVTHELVHALASRFAPGPFGMPMLGGLPAMGLVEGLAVAVAGVERGPGLHQAVAAMKAADLMPDPEGLMSLSGFYAQPASRAYPVAGSFVRHLLDTAGPEAVRKAYATGLVPDAFDGWRAMIEALPVSEEQVERARVRYRRGALFSKVCPHEVALRKRALSRRGIADDELVRGWREIIAWDPGDPGHLLDLAAAQLATGDEDGARESAAACRDHKDAPQGLKTLAAAQLADVDWAAGRPAEARAGFLAAVGRSGRDSTERMLRAKAAAAAHADGDAVRDYLLARKDTEVSLLALQESHHSSGWGLPAYLLGRRLQTRGEAEAAAPWLARAAKAGTGDPLLDGENLRLLGRALYGAGRFREAAVAFRSLLQRAPEPGYAEGAAAWLRRSEARGRTSE